MYLLAPFIMQNFKKIIRADPDLWRCAIFGPKMTICHEKNFLVQTIITFIYLLAFFIVQNLKKLLQRIQSYEDAPFLGPKWSICPKQFFFFFGKIVNIILIYLLAPFIGQNLDKTLPSYPELWGCTTFGPQMDHFP